MPIRALVFDAYGTLYDAQSVRALANELCGERGELVTQLWRMKQLEYTWLRGLMGAYEDFWSVTGSALDYALDAAGCALAEAERARLQAGYLSLSPYPEAAEALAALKGRRLAILSNGSPKMLADLVRNSGFDGVFDDVISVDRARTFKPDQACYALVEPSLGVPLSETLFVSSNGFDASGAKRAGLRVAWIERARGADAPAPGAALPAPEMYRLVRGRAERLGFAPDAHIARLTDLPDVCAALG